MDFTFEVITDEEYQRQRALYEPLTEAVRRLIYASLNTGVDPDTVAEARERIEAVTAMLEAEQRTQVPLLHEDTGRPLVMTNPAVGLRNAIAPPMEVQHDDGRCWAEFTLGPAYEGPPGLVHGGVCALVLDHLLGEAYIDRVEGAKTFARGFIADADGPTVEAEGVFIQPAWARAG